MSRTYYVNGSAVRELETQPLRRPERPDRRKIEEEQRKKRRRNAARRNRERELGMSKGYVLFLSACVCVQMITITHSIKRAITVAAAAPCTPMAGIGPKPKIKT